MSINNVNVTGRITNDIELRRTNNSGKSVINFTIAVNSYFKEEPEWVDCVIWGKLAENLATYCGKGSHIGITGRLQTSSYENQDGRRIKKTEVVVERLEFLGSSNRQQNNQYNQNYQNNYNQGYQQQNYNQNNQYNQNSQNYQNNGNNRNVRGYQNNNSNYSNNSNNYNGQNMQTYVPNNQNFQDNQNYQNNQNFQNEFQNNENNEFVDFEDPNTNAFDGYDMQEDDIQF